MNNERWEHLAKVVEKRAVEFKAAKIELDARLEELDDAEDRLAALTVVREATRTLAREVQSNVHKRVALLVTRCLQSVFLDDAYEFVITFVEKRGKTEAECKFVRGGLEVDPLTASGGGVVDVAAFALRIVALTLAMPSPRKTLILDEPFRFVSKDYRDSVRALVQALSEELGVQFIIVTHDPHLMIGKVIEL